MTQYNINHEGCRPISNQAVTILLAASTALSWTVPGTPNIPYRAKFSISSTADAWVCKGATAAVPTSNTVTSTPNQERIDLNTVLFVNGGDVLSFISTGTPQIGVTLLTLPY